ncbi:MAG: nicotinate-nucleotide adenylyltransferase [Ignavibacteria bacterium]|nr:nicotinate-nucleotide adenylyltransferase [Ignavibacteria bacterium]
MKRIGIYGGTFNPIHTAHLITAEDVKEQMHLDKVLFIPSARPPHKETGGLTEAAVRLEMVKLAIQGNDSFEVSDIELNLPEGSKSYTANTLLALREQFKSEQVKFYLIIGMDQLIELHTWKDPSKLFLLSEVIVINRPGYVIQQVENEFASQVIPVPVKSLDISSTDIRKRIHDKLSIKYLVPEEVEMYIKNNNLYN